MEIYLTVLSLILASAVAWVSYQNHLIGKEKLKLDLYERRYAVYEATCKLLTCITQNGTVTDVEIFEFRRGTNNYTFLFEKDIKETWTNSMNVHVI